jgi:BirA family transcriptional regulator, biotin operon repressor / biotin---[acetyl-CoA-carboxylase] ligase
MEVVRIHFQTIESTNTWVKQNAHELDHSKVTLVTAAEQTGGRGRFKRKWVSPSDLNLYATFAIFLEKHRQNIANLAQVLAISAAQIMDSLDFHPKLKWPNDLLIEGKKVAGILCETTPLSDELCVILGIGLNVNMPLELLKEIDQPATSFFAEDDVLRNIEDVTELLKNHFLQNLERFLEEGFHPFLNDYKKYMMHAKGDLVQVDDYRTIWTGAFEEINENGFLVLKLPSDEYKTFHSGEIPQKK